MYDVQNVKFSELCGFEAKQLEATQVSDTHQYTLYGGSRGPGKSYWLRWRCIRELLRLSAMGIDGAVGGLFCEDYPALKDRQISKISKEIPPWLGELKDSKAHGLGFHLKKEFGGGVLQLRNLDDPSKYQSAEFAFIAIDELTKNTLETFHILRGSLRWPGVVKPRFFAATNPGSRGHGWVKGLWIDGDFPPEMAAIKHEFAFIRALPTDNPHLDVSYWQMLESLPEHLARAWRYGDWDIEAGLFFSNFRRTERDGKASHIIEPFQIPAHWRLYGSVDHGHHASRQGEKPYIYLLFAMDDDTVNPHCYLIDEIAAAEWPMEKQITEVKQLESRYANRVEYRQGCPSMFTEWKKGAPTIAEDYSAAGLAVVPSYTDHVNGWIRCMEWLEDGADGLPRFRVFSRCKHFLRIIGEMIVDERHPDDIDPNCEDHPMEAWRHFIMSRPKPAIIPAKELPQYSSAWAESQRRGNGAKKYA